MQRILLAAARMCGVGDANADGAPQKAARKFLRSLPLPPGWNNEEWELLGTVVRYHRGAEPSTKRGPFSKIPVEQQNRVRGLAGILRLTRALRKCGVKSGTDLRGEKAAETVVLWLRGLAHDMETASRLAAGKHLLEEYLGLPLVLKPAAKPGQFVTFASRQAPGLEAPLQDLASPREVHAWVDSQLAGNKRQGRTNEPAGT